MRDNGQVERINDDNEKRINMLNKLVEHYETGAQYPVSLQMCRPFTLVVNGAFESCGLPHRIEKKYLTFRAQTDNNGGTIKTIIEDIDHILRVAHEHGKLFSEVGAAWGKKSKKFDLTGYQKFPVNSCFTNLPGKKNS